MRYHLCRSSAALGLRSRSRCSGTVDDPHGSASCTGGSAITFLLELCDPRAARSLCGVVPPLSDRNRLEHTHATPPRRRWAMVMAPAVGRGPEAGVAISLWLASASVTERLLAHPRRHALHVQQFLARAIHLTMAIPAQFPVYAERARRGAGRSTCSLFRSRKCRRLAHSCMFRHRFQRVRGRAGQVPRHP